MQLQKSKTQIQKILVLSITILSFFSFIPLTQAQTVSELNSQIDSYTDKIKKIDAEIEAQRKLIQTTSAKAGEIQSQINALNATRKKLQSDVTRTQDVIKKSELTIKKIDIEVTDKERAIDQTQNGLAESIRSLNKHSETPFIELIFDTETISDFLAQIVEIRKFKEVLIDKKYNLLDLTRELGNKKTEELKTKADLEKEKQILAGQQETIISNQNEKKTLLTSTQSEQAKYEQLLREKEAQKEAFNALVRDIESKIKILIDPKSFPSAAKSILSWPVNKIIVTQEFGGSEFAKNNPGIYGRPYHPGTDFGVPTGTKVMSVSSGKVRASGNTDAFPGCYAWGKWILVDHDNGLSSLYAHLSSILVSPGQTVKTGEVLALSGSTGYSTGPHLHLTVYATQGVKVGQYGTYKPGGSGCAATAATGPFADLTAYLDPMSYLPAI